MTQDKTPCPYGLWPSPLSPKSLSGDRRLDGAFFSADGKSLVWLEGRSGQGVLLAQRLDESPPQEITGTISVRAEVGYGGGDFEVAGDDAFFVAHQQGRIYRQSLQSGRPRAITPAQGWAAASRASPDNRWLVYVHHDAENVDRLAIVDADGKHWPRIFSSGHDFYMQPEWSPAGDRFAWIAWDHPNMPWDGSLLYVADIAWSSDGWPVLQNRRVVAGGPEIAAFGPQFSPDGTSLYYAADPSGWMAIHRYDLTSGKHHKVTQDHAEYSLPAWIQGLRTYAVLPDGRSLLAARNQKGVQQLVKIDAMTGVEKVIECTRQYTEISWLAVSAATGQAAVIGSNPRQPPHLVLLDAKQENTRLIARSSGDMIAPEDLANCEAIEWSDKEGNRIHGLLYAPPVNKFNSPGLPPLVVFVHGGPTSQVRAGWRADAQFLATRGYAVLCVNYRGSTGYGREYMLMQRGKFGLVDVQDSISGKEFLATQGRIDPKRTVILGGSAGGATVLQTLCDFPEAFTVGVNLFGVANQFTLASDTHKFESRYLDRILGPLPEASALYRARSPEFHADKIRRPLAIYQGAIDKVVPQAQSDAIAKALAKSGVPHIYHVYPNEGHGWRHKETIEHYYRSLDEFLRQFVIYA